MLKLWDDVREVDIGAALEALRKSKISASLKYSDLPDLTRALVENIVDSASINKKKGGVNELFTYLDGQYRVMKGIGV